MLKNRETIETAIFRLFFKTIFILFEDGFEIKPKYYSLNRFMFLISSF